MAAVRKVAMPILRALRSSGEFSTGLPWNGLGPSQPDSHLKPTGLDRCGTKTLGSQETDDQRDRFPSPGPWGLGKRFPGVPSVPTCPPWLVRGNQPRSVPHGCSKGPFCLQAKAGTNTQGPHTAYRRATLPKAATPWQQGPANGGAPLAAGLGQPASWPNRRPVPVTIPPPKPGPAP